MSRERRFLFGFFKKGQILDMDMDMDMGFGVCVVFFPVEFLFLENQELTLLTEERQRENKVKICNSGLPRNFLAC